ncbi:uncharacterized protein LOC144063740 isoform X2 [Vanacampus margaritifer]
MCATTKVKYEEELCGAQEENERRQLLSAECKQTRVVFNTADISDKYLRPQQQKLELPGVKGKEDLEPLQVKEEELPQSPNIKKEEQLPPCIKKEEEFTELPVTGVHLKTEDEGQYEENKGAESPRSSSSQPMATEIDEIGEKYLHSKPQEPEFPGVKEELEPLQVKEEQQLQPPNIKKENLPPCMKEEEDFTDFPLSGVHLKTEEGHYEENTRAEPPSCSSSQHMTTEIDGEHCGASQADSWLAPMSDGDNTSHTDDDEQSEGL